MIRSVLIGILAVAIVGTGFWGYKEHQEKNAILIKSENNYQRAFHELTYNIDLLHDELGSTLAMNSRERLSPSLAEVWRITSEAQNDLGQLPLALMPFSKTEEYLYKIGEFSYRHAIRDLNQDPLSEDEYEALQSLYEQSGEIQNEMRKVQSMVLRDNLRWMDVEMALASEEEPLDNAIVNGFHIINEKVDGFSEVNFGADASSLSTNDEEIAEKLSGDSIDDQEALLVAQKFLDLSSVDGAEVTETGEGLAYEAYSLTIPDEKHGTNITMDITKTGGHPVWMLNERDVDVQQISLNEGSENAKAFLEANGFDNMQLVDSKQYDNIGVFNFTGLMDNVRVYSDSVVLEVALDEGDVIGFEGIAYLDHNYNRDDFSQELSIEEAEERLNPNLDVMEHHLAIIENELGEEVLCHEFYGVINNDTYRIFINAEDGKEEQVEKLANAEKIYR
ncbi:germination protein YpeB [Evansella cellulosilytica]|uniref:Germination protein YpeB n=1 Tax=Evansella cellulosilytica (strain ATCC 21833 / DSM 2522 / FERM P-1141 / JCM 9156 / N-4) TaxID=649639 RepID=E6TZD5_EVAC2|nr:germination protein YpeB [Evansella cellulosilytica]ADU30109.1 germination protein YpeB [Evansella cellulosilytica DSM 2522]